MSRDYNLRLKVKYLLESGVTDIKFLRNATQLSRATIYNIKKKLKLGEEIIQKHKRVYNSENRNRLSNLANSQSKYSAIRLQEIAKKLWYTTNIFENSSNIF